MRGISVFDNKPEISAEEVRDGLETCTRQIIHILPEFKDTFPKAASESLFYEKAPSNGDWTTGFWTGEVWLAYEFSGEECLKEAALLQCDSFYNRIFTCGINTCIGCTITKLSNHTYIGRNRKIRTGAVLRACVLG